MNLTLSLSEQQAQELLQIADAAVRANGLQLVRQVVRLMDEIDAAAAKATTPIPPEEQQ